MVVLDGCPINCEENTLMGNDIKQFEHINITDFGIVKGQTPVTEAKINEICEFLKR